MCAGMCEGALGDRVTRWARAGGESTYIYKVSQSTLHYTSLPLSLFALFRPFSPSLGTKQSSDAVPPVLSHSPCIQSQLNTLNCSVSAEHPVFPAFLHAPVYHSSQHTRSYTKSGHSYMTSMNYSVYACNNSIIMCYERCHKGIIYASNYVQCTKYIIYIYIYIVAVQRKTCISIFGNLYF